MNNPEALIIVAFGILLVVVGFRNKADNLLAAAMGKPYGKSDLK